MKPDSTLDREEEISRHCKPREPVFWETFGQEAAVETAKLQCMDMHGSSGGFDLQHGEKFLLQSDTIDALGSLASPDKMCRYRSSGPALSATSGFG